MLSVRPGGCRSLRPIVATPLCALGAASYRRATSAIANKYIRVAKSYFPSIAVGRSTDVVYIGGTAITNINVGPLLIGLFCGCLLSKMVTETFARGWPGR